MNKSSKQLTFRIETINLKKKNDNNKSTNTYNLKQDSVGNSFNQPKETCAYLICSESQRAQTRHWWGLVNIYQNYKHVIIVGPQCVQCPGGDKLMLTTKITYPKYSFGTTSQRLSTTKIIIIIIVIIDTQFRLKFYIFTKGQLLSAQAERSPLVKSLWWVYITY